MSALSMVECERWISAFALCKDVSRGQKRSLCGEWGQDINTKWDNVERGYQHPLPQGVDEKTLELSSSSSSS